MTQTIKRKLNDSAVARWSAVILISLMMFFAYMFVDILSPMKENLSMELRSTSSMYSSSSLSSRVSSSIRWVFALQVFSLRR